MALWRRDRADRRVGDGLIHHSDAGSQYTSIAFAETLVLEGIAASIGSVGDAYDNALAETTIGLFKTEAIGRGSPFLAGPLGPLVHQPLAAQPARVHPARRIRDRLLRSHPGAPASDASTLKPPSNLSRFMSNGFGADLGARPSRQVRRRDGVRLSTGRLPAGRRGCSEASSAAREHRCVGSCAPDRL